MILSRRPVSWRLRKTHGFTLTEMMIALVLTGIVVTILYQLVATQSRLSHHQSKQENVQQNARGTVALLTSELRTIPRGALVSATENAIRFRAPRVWGVVCGVVSGTSSIDVLVPRTAAPYPVDAGSRLVVGRQVGKSDQENWEATMQVTGITASTGPTDAGVCTNPLPANSQRLRFTVSALPTNGVQAQALTYFGEEISYHINGGWIERQRGDDVAQPFAGVAESLTFSYYEGANSTPTAGTPADLGKVTRIGINIRMRSQQGGDPVVQADSTMVYLRNRV